MNVKIKFSIFAVCLLFIFTSAQSQTALCVTPQVPGEWDLQDLATQDIPITLDAGDVGDAFTTAYTVRSTEFRMIHTYAGDLGGRLISPDGTNVHLWQLGDGTVAPSISSQGSRCNEGGYDIEFSDTTGGVNLTIANENTYCVGNNIDDNTGGAGGTGDPFTFTRSNPSDPAIQGTATPIESLSNFNGDNINGTWTARITDSYAQDDGAITEVCLDVTFAGVDHEFFVSSNATCNDSVDTNTFAFGDTFYVCQNVVNKGTETFQVEFLADTSTDIGTDLTALVGDYDERNGTTDSRTVINSFTAGSGIFTVGTHTFNSSVTVTGTDINFTIADTLTAPESISITIAPAAPVINSPTNGAPVTGTGEPGATVSVSTSSGGTCTAVVLGNGTWSCTIVGSINNGDDISAFQELNPGVPSPTTTITGGVDTVAPTIGTCSVTPDPANDGTVVTASCNGVEAGSVLTIPGYVCSDNGSGNWSCTGTVGTGGVDGDEVATATDTAGNTNTTPATFTLDNTDPTIGTCSVTPDPANDGTVVTASCNGVEAGSVLTIPGYVCSDNGSGNWSCTGTVGTGGVDGDEVATATDTAGNTNTTPATFTLDNTDPTIGTCSVTPDPANNGTVVTATCTGVETGAVVTIPGYTCGAEAGGTVSCTGTVGTAGVDGDETATATDAAGNTADTPATFTVDNTPPSIGTCSVTPDPANDGTVVTASCNGVEAGSVLTIPGYVCTDNGSGNWSCTGTVGTGGVDGDEVATATDTAGNTNTTPATFTLDNTDPTIGTCSVTPDPANDGTVVTASCNGVEAGSVLTIPGYVCTDNGSGNWSCTGTVGTGGVDGDEVATATDTAGNTNTTPATFTLDNTDPTIGTCSVTPDPANDGTVVTASCNGVEAGSVLTIPGYVCTDNGSGNWSCTGTVGTGGVDGDEVATATDTAGNTSTTPATFTLDNDAPAAPGINTPTNGAPVTGTGEPGATVTVTTPSGSTCTALVQPDGSWSCTLAGPPVNGEDITATQEDDAGNTSPPTTVTGGIDTTAPSAPVINPVNENTDPITGTAEPGSTINLTGVTCDNDPVITNSNGQWTCETTNSVPLTPGDLIVATATDDAGNVSQPASTTVGNSATESVAPTVNPVVNGATVITGSAVAGSVINIDGITCSNAPVTANASGQWSCDSPNPVPVTDDIIMVTATQSGLLESPPVSTTVYNPSTTSPPAPQVNPTDGDPVTGTTIPNGDITVLDANGVVLCTTTADALGNFSCSPVLPAPVDGDVLSVIVTDDNGNASLPTQVTVDTVAPGVAVCTVTPDPANTGTALTATCTGVETGATVTIPGYVCGTEAGNEVVCTATAGQNGVDGDEVATVTDAAGNSSDADVFFTLDNTAPAVAVCTVTPDPANNGTALTATCTGVETDAVVTIPGYVCGTEAGNEVVCTATAGQNGVDGDEVATVTDAAGNSSDADAIFTLDNTAPAVAVCTVTPDPANTGTALTATCTGVETGATVTIPGYVCGTEAGNEVVCTATAGQNGVDGDEVATVTDAAGNSSDADVFFTLDNTAPAVAVCTVTPDPANTGTELTATCTGVETGATVTIPGYVCGTEAGNEVVCTATAGQNGVDGDEVATVTDAAGNSSDADAIFTLDNTAPAAPVCTVTPDPANNGTVVTATCTGVETDATVTIPGYVCGVESGNEVVCTATVGQNGVDGDETATTTDEAGNSTDSPATFTLDNTAPDDPSITSPTDGLTVSGTGEVGATVNVTTPSGASCEALVQSDGTWSCDLSPEPVDGEIATAIQTDAANNDSAAVTAIVAYAPDLNSFITNCVAGVQPNEAMLYEVSIMNTGNIDITGAQVTTVLGDQMSNPTWICQAIGGATCDNAGGNGDLNELVNLPSGSGLIYMFDSAVTGALMGFIDVEATVTMPPGTTDVNSADNSTFDSDLIYQFIFKDSFECAAPGTVESSNNLLESMFN